MTQSAPTYPITAEFEPERRRGLWILVILLTLLIHFLFFLTHVDWGTPKAPPRVDVEQVDPQKLAQIRKHWRDQEKGLLLDQNQPKAEQAPDNARYMSDRNIRVEKEQRARDHVIQPKPGANSQTQEKTKPQLQPHAQAQAQPQIHARGLPQLGNLGVPFRLSEQAKQSPRQRSQTASSAASPPGGQQYIDDKNLPEGSENILNAEESVYYSFYARLYDAIGPIWASRLRELAQSTRVQPGDYTTAVDVVLDKEGNLVEVRIMQSSQVRVFDEAVNSSWSKIGKFPNPPSGLIKEDGKVHTGWNFTVQVGSGGGGGLMLMPPERSY